MKRTSTRSATKAISGLIDAGVSVWMATKKSNRNESPMIFWRVDGVLHEMKVSHATADDLRKAFRMEYPSETWNKKGTSRQTLTGWIEGFIARKECSESE